MRRPENETAGFYMSHDPLSPNDRTRLMRLATWHLSQGPDDWPLDTGAPKAHARALQRLDALDHAECAARLEAIADGYSPPDLVIDDSFGLLTRPAVVL